MAKMNQSPKSYRNTLRNTLGLCPKPKNCQQLIRIEHEKPSYFVSQSESWTKKPLNFVGHQNRVLRQPRALGSSRLVIAYLNTRDPNPPPPHHLCSLFFYSSVSIFCATIVESVSSPISAVPGSFSVIGLLELMLDDCP